MSVYKYITFCLCVGMTYLVHADPWFMGPILANPGIVSSIGEGFFEIHGQSTRNYGVFDNQHVYESTPLSFTDNLLLLYNYGITDDIDTTMTVQYMKNRNEGKSSHNIGDSDLTLGLQLLRQEDSIWKPDIRLTLGETFPTGRYDLLTPQNDGTDAMGGGSYMTSLGLNMQHLSEIDETHYVSQYANIIFTYATPVSIHGLSAYGGTPTTIGHIRPGNSITIDLAAEFSLTQHWGAIMESFFYYQEQTIFNGQIPGAFIPIFGAVGNKIDFLGLIPSIRNLGVQNIGSRLIGNGSVTQMVIAPALEYAITENIGLIGGATVIIYGKNSPASVLSTLVLTMSW